MAKITELVDLPVKHHHYGRASGGKQTLHIIMPA
jgi:hypothetical protein